MRPLGQLTAGARSAQARRAEGDVPPPPGGGGPRRDPPDPAAPPSREDLLRLVEAVAPRLGLGDKTLRALRAIVTACRWADFTGERPDPVCFRQQQRLAEAIGVSPGHFRKLEARLEAAGLIERRTAENGYRGRLAPGGPVAGLAVAPLLASLPRLRAMARAMAAEAEALAEGRALIRIERRAVRHAVEALPPGHPLRHRYHGLRGARFPAASRYDDARAIAAHLAELGVLVEAARRALDHADRSGAPRPEERRHTENPTDPQTGSWSGAVGGEGVPGGRASGTGRAEAQGREEEERAEAGHSKESDGARTSRPDAPETPDRNAGEGTDGNGDDAAPRGTCLPRRLAAQLTPALLRELSSEEMRLYVDHLDPRPRGRPPTLRDVERAALMRRRELEVSPALWEEVEAAMGWLDALVALVVVDANRHHPTAPVRNAPGLLRDLARRRRAGVLDLGASVMGLWRRRAEG